MVEVEGDMACGVFLNGRRVGSAPFRWEHGVPGESRIEIECGGQRSRVHIVNLGERAVTLRISPDRDERVNDESILALWYGSEAELRHNLIADARAIGALIAAQQMVLANETADGDVLLVRFDLARARAVAATLVPKSALRGDEAAAWDHAADTLQRERLDVALPPVFLAQAAAQDVVQAAPPTAGPGALAANASTDSPPSTSSEPSLVPDGAPGAPSSSTPTGPAARAQQRQLWPWLLGGASVIAAGTGLGLTLAALGKHDDYTHCTGSCEALKDKGERLQLSANIAFGVGGALLVGALTTYFVTRGKSRDSASAFWLQPTGAGIRGQF
jgi:hypothetical protein